MRPPRPSSVRIALASVLISASVCSPPVLAQAALDAAPQAFQIEAQPLDAALNELARQAGLQLLFSQEAVAGRQAPPVSGELTPRQALDRLLQGSGLAATVRGQAIVVAPRPPAPAPASRSGGDRVLGTVTVSAAADRGAASEGSNSYTPRRTSIGKTEQTLREIPQSVTVVTRQQMDDQNATNLSDVLSAAAGITLYGNANGASSFSTRRNYMMVQYDGVPGFGSLGGNQFDMSMYDRIEILRGPSGVLQGAGDPSGVANLVRKRPLREQALGAAMSVGSWKNVHAEVDANLPLTEDGRLRARAVLAGDNRHFFYDRARDSNRMGYGIVEWDLTSSTTVALSMAYQRSKPTSFSGFPAYNDGSGFLGLPRSTNLDAPWTQYHRSTRETVFDLSHRFNDDWTLKGVVRRRDADHDYLNGLPRGGVNRDTGLGSVLVGRGETESLNLGADLHLAGKYRAWGQEHSLLVGYNYDRYRSDSGGASRTASGVDIRDPRVYDDLFPGPITNRSGNRTTQSGFYTMNRFKILDSWAVILGGRLTDYQNETRTIAPTPADWTRAGRARARSEFSPYVATVIDLSANLSLYASYADIFVPQTAIQWGGGVVEPRVGWQGEVGVKGSFFNDQLNASLGFYRIRDENRAIQDPDPTHVGSVCGSTPTSTCSLAAGLVQVEGIDLELSGQLTPRLQLVTSYTYSTGKYLRDSDNADGMTGQPYNEWIPKHLFKFWAKYQVAGPWHLAGGIHAQTRAHGTGYPNYGISGVRQPGYAVTSIQVGRQLSRRVSAALTVNNLFDRNYIGQINDDRSYNYYGEPRSVTFTMRGNF